MKVLATYVEETESAKTGTKYSRFCTIGTFESILVNSEYIRNTLELIPSHLYVIDVLPFYSEAQDRAFLAYKVLAEAQNF